MRRTQPYFFVLFLGVVAGAGIAALVTAKYASGPSDFFSSSTRKIIPVRSFQQETEYSCGGAVAKAILDYYGTLRGRSEAELSQALRTGMSSDHPGTRPDDFVAFLRSEGFNVSAGEKGSLDLIYHYLDQAVPVIVLDSSWGGHWRLIVGYDWHGDRESWEDNVLFFVDPEQRALEPDIDRRTGIMMENESRFDSEWYENRLFDHDFMKYFIIAHPHHWNIREFSRL